MLPFSSTTDLTVFFASVFILFFFFVGNAGKGRSLISSHESMFKIGGSQGLYISDFVFILLLLLTLLSVVFSVIEWSDDCTDCLLWSLKRYGKKI